MKKIVSATAAVLLAMLALVGLAPAASAYPDLTPNLTLDRQTIYSGGTFTATASATGRCDWTLEWNGQTRTKAAADTFSTTYTAPKVKKPKEIILKATCTYVPTDANGRAAADPVTRTATATVVVLPASETVPNTGTAGSDDDLPSTGGPNFWFLLAGVALLITGTGAVLVARRRAENGDALAGLS